jgi:DNA-binding LytR/AlgR family response regulator
MNCIIIEDGRDAAEYLEHQIRETVQPIEVIAKIGSVKDSISWLKNNHTDLIFLDIQLSDGISFEIFDNVQVNTPVIFTTSYDQYAIQAFELNSISYLLKPVKSESLRLALEKYGQLYPQKADFNDKVTPLQQEYQRRFYVESGNSIKSIPIEDVAYFRVQSGRHLIIVTHDGQQFLYENTLERLELRLDPIKFFRINRQFIIHIDAIHQMTNYDSRRIKVETVPECKDELLVAMTKMQAFREWLDR